MILAFFINLNHHTDRRQFIEAQIAGAGLIAERVSGVDGDNLPSFAVPYFQNCLLSPGEIGCYASHLLVWRAIVARELPYALVLEDDVQIETNAAKLLGTLIDELPREWDCVHMSGKPRNRSFAMRPLKDLPGCSQLVRFARVPDGAFAYLISNEGARKLLAPKPRSVPVDTDLRRPWLWSLDLYGVSNPPFRPASFASIIDRRGGRSRRLRKHRFESTFRSPRSFLFNFSKLGPYWWCRCFVENVIAKASRSITKDRFA